MWGGFQLAILDAGRIAGVAGFLGVDWANRSTSVGYWLSEERQGRGTMTREEGTLRQAERVGGRYLDTVVYSMLRADWDPAARR